MFAARRAAVHPVPGRSSGSLYTGAVSRSLVERRLVEVSSRLRTLRGELQVADEQLLHLAEQAEEARLRALVSETPVAERDHREASRHAEAMQRFRAEVQQNIEALEASQDDLLDRLSELLSSPTNPSA